MVTVRRTAVPTAYIRTAALVGLLTVFGVTKLAQAFVPIDVADAATTTGAVHNALGNLAFFTLPAAAVLSGRLAARVGAGTRPALRVPVVLRPQPVRERPLS